MKRESIFKYRASKMKQRVRWGASDTLLGRIEAGKQGGQTKAVAIRQQRRCQAAAELKTRNGKTKYVNEKNDIAKNKRKQLKPANLTIFATQTNKNCDYFDKRPTSVNGKTTLHSNLKYISFQANSENTL